MAQDVLINHKYDFNCIMCRVKNRTLDVLLNYIKQSLINVIVVFHDTTIN